MDGSHGFHAELVVVQSFVVPVVAVGGGGGGGGGVRVSVSDERKDTRDRQVGRHSFTYWPSAT